MQMKEQVLFLSLKIWQVWREYKIRLDFVENKVIVQIEYEEVQMWNDSVFIGFEQEPKRLSIINIPCKNINDQ